MKTILITGLDGSGKSTLLSKLAKEKDGRGYDILFVPQIEASALDLEPELLKVAHFINTLNVEGDLKQQPHLKAIALFASMLLFKQLHQFYQNNKLKTLYCERHPLIDTGVYARFYASKLNPAAIDSQFFSALDARFPMELDSLLQLLPTPYRTPNVLGRSATFLQFIYDWFFVEGRFGVKELIQLFDIPLPDQIYFLNASPDILYARIADRELKEAHESVEVFTKLKSVYEALFDGLKNHTTIEEINANEIELLNGLFDKINRQHL
ncbi:MAG: hypothetical protein KDC34_02480 [Saprospiraceae bacterium]|nr:hypothetical protein [Saprospiraceae bacterium]